MNSEYWTRKRQTRRRLLQGAGVGSLGFAAFSLVGCGDDDDDGGSGKIQLATPTPAAGATPIDPFAGAKKGGTLKLDNSIDPPTIDPYGNVSVRTKTMANYVYSRLLKYKTGPQYKQGNVRPTGDLAEKVEASADGLKYTFRLRQGIKFHNIAPLNGRALSIEDVRYSWGKATDVKNSNRGQLAFIDKVEYPDDRTVVMSLKAPNAAFLDVIADASLLYIVPTEAESGFNMAKSMIGTGPWVFESYQPSIGFKFKRNPEWYETGFPLVDAIEITTIPDYANRVAQFQAGATDATALNAQDLTEVKKAVSAAQFGPDTSVGLSFIYFDSDPSSPWAKDDRVRQAVSMCLDRDALTEVAFNVKAIKAAGIDASIKYNNVIPISVKRWWLDPQSPEHGETGKFFKYDVAEAKKLLSAAGYPDGFSTTYQYTGNGYGLEHNQVAEAQIAMLQALGLKTTTDVQDYNSKYITQTFVGNFKGIAFGLETSFPEGSGYVLRLFTDDPNNHGRVKDPVLEKLAVQQQSELNEEKRRQIFHDIQRENAKHMYYVPSQAGAGTRWVGYQGHVKNALEFYTQGYGAGTELHPYKWKA